MDLVSISGNKIEGPKDVGALVLLNEELLSRGFRPPLWGGEQEGGFQSGTQNAELIAEFHAAAEKAVQNQEDYLKHGTELHRRLKHGLGAKNISNKIHWNSPEDAVPCIVNLSVQGVSAGDLAKALEDKICIISTGAACNYHKVRPCPVLNVMGFPVTTTTTSIRISTSLHTSMKNIDTLVSALADIASGLDPT